MPLTLYILNTILDDRVLSYLLTLLLHHEVTTVVVIFGFLPLPLFVGAIGNLPTFSS